MFEATESPDFSTRRILALFMLGHSDESRVAGSSINPKLKPRYQGPEPVEEVGCVSL